MQPGTSGCRWRMWIILMSWSGSCQSSNKVLQTTEFWNDITPAKSPLIPIQNSKDFHKQMCRKNYEQNMTLNLSWVFVGLFRVYLNFAAEGLIKSQSVYIFKTFKIYTLITRVIVAVDVEDEDIFMFFVSIFFCFWQL